MNVSLADLKRNYGNLDVHFDLWKGESDAEPYIPWLIQDLQDKGLAYESQGALVVDIAEPTDSKELPPCIVRKSDGAALYATSDLGTILEREKDFCAGKIYLYYRQAPGAAFYPGIPCSEKGWICKAGNPDDPYWLWYYERQRRQAL